MQCLSRYRVLAGCTARRLAPTAAVGGRQAMQRRGHGLAAGSLHCSCRSACYLAGQAGVTAVPSMFVFSPSPAAVTTHICMLPHVMSLPVHMRLLNSSSASELNSTVGSLVCSQKGPVCYAQREASTHMQCSGTVCTDARKHSGPCPTHAVARQHCCRVCLVSGAKPVLCDVCRFI